MPEPRAVASASGDATELAPRQPRAIHSALTVLEAVAELGAGATAREISVALGLPRATAYRLLNLLVQDEFLVRTPDLTGFALGAKVVHLASVAAPVRLPTAARLVLEETRARARGGVHVVLYPEGRVALADADPDFPFSDPVRLSREPGRFALGRLLLAERAAPDRPDGRVGRLADGVLVDGVPAGIAEGVPAGIADAVVGAAVQDVRRFGAARQLGELVAGYGCLAIPIRDASGALAGALGFSGPVHRVEDPRALVELLAPAASRLGPLLT